MRVPAPARRDRPRRQVCGSTEDPAGTEYFTVTGRSITFSTVTGRVEVNLDTGEVTYHGRLNAEGVFDPNWTAPICAALS